jgi:signal transduction histidine kinase
MNYFRQEIEKMNRLSTVAEIASAVAHEVRNPLAGIKTMSQSIEENIDDDDDNKEYIKRIIKQVDRLNQLLSEFFTYAKPGEPKKTRTSLIDIINDTKPLIQSKLDKKNIKLSEHYQKGLPHIFADQNQIQQVFLNLMLNSIDALEHKGAIEIQADRLRQDERKNYIKVFPALRKDCEYIVVHFKDNGIGMTPEVAEKVFEPFFTTKHNGSGLGLSIVYRILKENNAAIYVDCAESGTTAFKMFLEADE